MVRARAGIAYTLAEAMSNGHCGLAEDELLIQAEKLLEIPSSILAEALLAELATGAVVADTIAARRCIFLTHLWRAEKLIAHRLQALIHETPPWPAIEVERASAGSRRSSD
jgi:exodeoxyribonuclease V alpha subunit